jgi:hypothetical protein
MSNHAKSRTAWRNKIPSGFIPHIYERKNVETVGEDTLPLIEYKYPDQVCHFLIGKEFEKPEDTSGFFLFYIN